MPAASPARRMVSPGPQTKLSPDGSIVMVAARSRRYGARAGRCARYQSSVAAMTSPKAGSA